MLTKKEQGLLEALEPIARDKGVDLVMLEIVGARKSPTIRVYIDTERGVGFDELSSAQSWINDFFDKADPFPGAYTLEVSSPGIDRPLRTLEHFSRFAGEKAVLKTKAPIENRSTFTGILLAPSVKDGQDVVSIDCDGSSFEIPFTQIKRANLKGTIDFQNKSGKE